MALRPHPVDVVRSVRRFGPFRGVGNCVRASRRQPGATKLHLADGRYVLLRRSSSDWETFSEIFLDECYRDDFVELFGPRRAPHGVRNVVDVGANVGYASVYFRSRYPNATIWAIEPDAENFEMLVQNTNRDAAVRPIHGAVWNVHEPVAIDTGGASNAVEVRSSGDGSEATVQGHTMDDVLAMVPGSHIDVLKIDVEGAERRIFGAGSTNWLDHVDLIFIELHDWKQAGSTRAYHEALRDFDYAEFALGGTVGTLVYGRRSTR